MMLQHVWGLFAHPEEEWRSIRQEGFSIGRCYCSHVLFLAAIPPVAGFIGTAFIGWRVVAGGEVVKLTLQSAATIAALYYMVILVAVFTIGKLIQWMGQTYGATLDLSKSIGLAAYTATPLFLISVMGLYPVLWLNLVIGLPALAYTVYLFYTGVPIMTDIPKERGFLFASAVLAVGLVTLVAVMASTVLLWEAGLGPSFKN